MGLSISIVEGLRDEGVSFEQALDANRRDLLPTGRYHELLLSVRDGEKSIPVELTNVAGMKPSLGVPRFRCRLGSVQIPLRDIRAAHQDLSIRGRDAYLYLLQSWPHRSYLAVGRKVYMRGHAGLRQPISLADNDTERVEESVYSRI